MRCQFCGWDNPQGKDVCEKCNKPLVEFASRHIQEREMKESVNHDRPTERKSNSGFNPKATVRENFSRVDNGDGESEVCPECGYPLENGKCSSCGYDKNAGKAGDNMAFGPGGISGDVRKTVRPIRKGEKGGFFTLTPISEESGEPEGDALSYEGDSVVLNRDNTDPKNSTITSVKQAVVYHKDGKWTIEDHSEYRTTFVQAARGIELQEGDLVLLGNQLYRFDLNK